MANEETSEERMARLQREAAQQVGSGLLSWLNPFNYGLFTWIVVGIAGFIGYNALSGDKGEGGGLLSKLFNMLPEGMQKWAAETFGGVDGDAALKLRKVAQEAGYDGLSKDDYFKPEVLYPAMLKAPDALLDIAKGMPKTGAANGTAMEALRQIVNDPTKLATLLSAEHKAGTYALLEGLSPITFKAGALGQFIDATAKRDGTIDPAFTKLLNAMLTDGDLMSRIKPEQLSAFFSRPGNAAAFGKLLAAVDEKQLTPAHRKLLTTIRENWGTPTEGLAEVVADKDSLAFLIAMNGKPQTTTDKLVGMVPDTIKVALGKAGLTTLPDKVGENIAQLLTVQNAFKEAGVEMGGAAAAPKRPGTSASVAH